MRTCLVVSGTSVCEHSTARNVLPGPGAHQSASKETPRQQLPYK